jgi:hypothetical protein
MKTYREVMGITKCDLKVWCGRVPDTPPQKKTTNISLFSEDKTF